MSETSAVADVTFVVPTRNSDRTLAACLNSLISQHTAEVEVIVVDNHSQDSTLELAKKYATTVLTAGPERSAQRNRGLEHASAEVVVFVDSDMICELGLAQELKNYSWESDACAVIQEHSFGRGYLARARSVDRAVHQENTLVEAARAFSRRGLMSLGGFNEELSAGEDWELDDRVKEMEWVRYRARSKIWHDEGSIHLHDLYRKKRYYADFLIRYLETAPGRKGNLVGRYVSVGVWKQLLRSAWYLPGIGILKATEALAFLNASRASHQNSHQ